MEGFIYSNKLKSLIIFAFFIFWIALFQYKFDFYKSERPLVEPTILSAEIVKLIDLGLNSAAASYMWLNTIQDELVYPDKIPDYIGLVNDLDPKFSYPYAFAVLILPNLHQTDQAMEIGRRGLAQADPDWRIPFYMATTYHVSLGDRKNAGLYFEKAAFTPGAPEKIKQIAINYGSASNLRNQSREIWTSIYESSDDEVIRARALAYITHYNYLDLLDEAVRRYKEGYGSYPKSLNDLVSKRILKAIPTDPFGLNYSIDAKGKIMVIVPN